MEIGGYIEFEHYNRPMLHENAIKLNCGRNALAYLIEAKAIKRIVMPLFMCDSCDAVFKRYNVQVRYYSIGLDFKPKGIQLEENEWLYVVNFYGQLSNEYLGSLKDKFSRLIVDNAQAYFQMPIHGVDTLYTCRKFFGVADGAILYTNKQIERELSIDESFERMGFLLGRFERSASEFYSDYVKNNHIFNEEPIKIMSKLTENLLRGIDYEEVKQKRSKNFAYLHEKLKTVNKLQLACPEGAFMYPLYIENGAEIRKRLQEKKIFVPTLWPAVLKRCNEDQLEYDMAKDILPLSVDQRYTQIELEQIIKEFLNV